MEPKVCPLSDVYRTNIVSHIALLEELKLKLPANRPSLVLQRCVSASLASQQLLSILDETNMTIDKDSGPVEDGMHIFCTQETMYQGLSQEMGLSQPDFDLQS